MSKPIQPKQDRAKHPKQTQQAEHVDASRISRDIPSEIKIGIADIVMAFATMEGYAESLIWMLVGIHYDDGVLLTRMDARPKFELLREFYQRYVDDDHESENAKAFWQEIGLVTQLRNKIVHGMWAMIDGKVPACASFRLNLDFSNAADICTMNEAVRA